MSMSPGGSLERVVQEIFGPDPPDYLGDPDIRVVDELSEGWQYGRDAISSYLKLRGVEDPKSRLDNLHTYEFDQTGIVTFELQQVYGLNGLEREIVAPTTVVGRREGDEWRIVLIHAVATLAA
jgi:hypothetical protein